jgi:hypothetical protein
MVYQKCSCAQVDVHRVQDLANLGLEGEITVGVSFLLFKFV